jgi:DnaJ-class molecular chaperone
MNACHVCTTCSGAGTLWNRILRVRETCPRCGGSGSGLAR